MNKGARLARHSALPEECFIRRDIKTQTVITSAAYKALLRAAKAKNKLPELAAWMRDRKITIK